ncbi:MAG: metallophosphatase family protein [Bacteroidia bacterium]|jgi:hypothetical protein|nr:metallophosphatase family protein [Bacteroidia bacterium]
MKKVGLISDTHGYIPKALFSFLEPCDEVWHAGDWGSLSLYQELHAFKPIRAVWGNIDGREIRAEMPEILEFTIEELKVCMLHIGGYPGKYAPGFAKVLKRYTPDLMVCGHSHILKVMKDQSLGLMHMNPGAAGIHGFHTFCTALRFNVSGKQLSELEVWELSRNQALVQPNE